ncbi:MAG TPA: MBL fold metallo-hydrolase [Dissulfurispiraceae bacterium]|nr:MBL fold metallo-hydrolase [Dissulfurispiraceae bacterium]
MQETVQWLGHDTFKIAGSKIIFTDPYQISTRDVADIIVITHDHYDHCSPDDIEKLRGPHTVVLAPSDCAPGIAGSITTIAPGDTLLLDGVTIIAVPAYNTNKQFHTRDRGWVGYIIKIDGTSIYFAGDTDHIPEMSLLGTIDIALLPVSGTYVMTADEAAQAALAIRPKLAIPMHFGSIVGTRNDAEHFADILKGTVEVRILKRGQSSRLSVTRND